MGRQTFDKDQLVFGSGNVLTGPGSAVAGSVGVYATDFEWEGAARNFTLTGTEISDYIYGVLINPLNGMTSDADIHFNKISGNQWGVENNYSGTIDATNNWWGDLTGPELAANPCGEGDQIAGEVLYNPWQNETMDQEIHQLLAFEVTGTTAICEGETADISLSGSQEGANYEYTLFVNGSAEETTVGTGESITWTVTPSDGDVFTAQAVNTVNGCELEMTGSPTITVFDPVAVIAVSNSPVLEGESIELTGGPDGMVSYSWVGPDGFTSDEQNPIIDDAALAMEGEYTLTVVDENNCTYAASVEVIVFDDTDIPMNIDVSDQVISEGEAFCFDALQTVTVWDFIVEAGGSAELIAGESIHLLPGTTVESGGYLLARIAVHLDDYCGIPHATEQDPYTSGEDPLSVDPLNKFRKNGFFKLYPNPTQGTFKLDLTETSKGDRITVEAYDMMGGRIFGKELPPQRQHSLSLEGQQPGIYIIRVTQGDRFGVERLIKR